MVLIVMLTVITYFILIAWTIHNLGNLEKSKKAIYIVVGIIIFYFITFIVFQIAKRNIVIDDNQIQSQVQNILVTVFAGLNGIVVMPQIAKTIDKIREDEIDQKQLQKRIIILIAVFIICLIFETGYMKDTQEGILKMYQAIKG